MDDLWTTGRVAKELGISPSRVRRMALDFDLGRLIGPRTRVFTPADLAAMRARSTGKAGRPRIHPENATGAAPKGDAG